MLRPQSVNRLAAALAVTFSFALFGGSTACKRPAHPTSTGVPYIRDDLSRALAEGKQTHRPVVVDIWATWCEPCRIMAASLEDAAVTSLRDRFVWASLDRDEESNAPAFARYPVKGLPTLWVIDPASEKLVFTTHGAETPAALRRILLASEEVARGTDWDEKAVAERWIAALEREPPRTIEERVITAERLLPAYETVGRPEAGIPLCEQLERDLPTQPGPPFTLARVYLAAGRLDDARAAVARASRLQKGRLTFAIYRVRADIEEKAGATEALIAVLEEAIATARRLGGEDPNEELASIIRDLEIRLAVARSRR